MANPQLENGYTKIANEILEALARIRIPGEARQVLDFVLRKTYGFHKKEDVISLSQIVLGTNLKKADACRAIRKLLLMNLIIIGKKATLKGKTYRFNKDFETWKPIKKHWQKSHPVGNKANKSLAIKHTTKETIQKKEIGETSSPTHFTTKELIDRFFLMVLEVKGYKPSISGNKDGAIAKKRVSELTRIELESLMPFYLNSDKCKEFGASLSVCLSTATINQWRESKVSKVARGYYA